MASRKRERSQEEESGVDISSIGSESPMQKVQGVILNVSPLKKGRTGNSYFDGKITDGTSTMRFVGFGDKVRRKIVEWENKDTAVTMSNCDIKRGRRETDGLELHLRNNTEVEKSDKVFDVTQQKAQQNAITDIVQIATLGEYERVTVEGKAVELNEAKEVSGGKHKQDVVIGDSSGSTKLTLWEEEIGKVVEGKSYRFTAMMVREFKGKKFLSTSKVDSIISEIEDIGEIILDEEESEIDDDELIKVHNVKVIGVNRLTVYTACIKCNSKVEVDIDDEEVGECTKCKVIQSVEECKQNISALLIFKASDGSVMSLQVYDQALLDIIEKHDCTAVTAKMLIKAKTFSMQHRNGRVQSIWRN